MTKFLEKLRTTKDIIDLAVNSTLYRDPYNYDKLADKFAATAQQIASSVESGKVDPVVAEYALALNSPPPYPELEASRGILADPRAENAGKALYRLVNNGYLDPVVAEEVLNSGFSAYAVNGAIDTINNH